MYNKLECFVATRHYCSSLFFEHLTGAPTNIRSGQKLKRRHDTQHNDIQPNVIKPKGLISEIEHNDTQLNYTQHNETLPLC